MFRGPRGSPLASTTTDDFELTRSSTFFGGSAHRETSIVAGDGLVQITRSDEGTE